MKKNKVLREKKLKAIRRLLIILILAMGEAACGYRFVGRETNLPGDIKTLAIPLFTNQTDQIGLESEITQALRERFISSKRLVIQEEKSANLVLKGKVKSFNTTSVAVTKGLFVTSGYRAMITIEIILKRHQDGQVLWKDELSEGWNYPVGVDLMQTEYNKKEAIRQIALLLAERVHETVLGGF
ncbi:MAG: LPS assembly lipoprotein LptE [Thermodesulfobacteriota bacterium]